MSLLPPSARKYASDDPVNLRMVIRDFNTDDQAVLNAAGTAVDHKKSAVANAKLAAANVAWMLYPADTVWAFDSRIKGKGDAANYFMAGTFFTLGLLPVAAWAYRILTGPFAATKNGIDAARHGVSALFGVETKVPPKV